MKHKKWIKRVAALIMAGGLCMGSVADWTAAEDKIAKLHNPIVDKEAGTVTFSYVYMGVYPQSEISGEALTDEIIQADYISGEAVVDGKQYRMETEDGKEDGKKHYFLYEPIRWRVISFQGNQALLRSDQILDYQYYNSYMRGGRWEDTSLQVWLNGYKDQPGFLQTAFTEKEAGAITEKEIEDYKTAVDKVFVLTAAEHYSGSDNFKGFGNILKLTIKTGYANWKSSDHAAGYGEYWARKPLSSRWAGLIPYINKKGDYCDEWWDTSSNPNQDRLMVLADEKELGVCPAVMLDVTQTDQWGLTPEEIKNRLEEDIIPGDLDGDKSVSLSDAQLALRAALKIIMLDKTETAAADIDGDGSVSLSDAQLVLKMALKIIA